MKKYIITFTFLTLLFSCESINGDLNSNPNKPTDVPSILLLRGAMLADVTIQAGHLQRISGMWSGHFVGAQSLYKSIYEYNFTAAESNSIWFQIYTGVGLQVRTIQNQYPNDGLLQGICSILEAHAIGTAASIFGDIPYSEAWNKDISHPKFDNQRAVFNNLQQRLDQAITSLNGASAYNLESDLFFTGDKAKWIAVANTLKARYYLQTKEYARANTAAKNGISSDDQSMVFKPLASVGVGDSNLLHQLVTSGSRSGDMVSAGAYLMDLLDAAHSSTRNNAKTDETARRAYYSIDGDDASKGASAKDAPHRLVTYEENLLILAETEARAGNNDEALANLNKVRAFLNSGNAFTKVNAGDAMKYEPYVSADFASGGMENADGIDAKDAILREVIEERYVSGYGQFMPFNDACRLRKSDNSLAVPFPTNTGSRYPERFVISQDEVNGNSKAAANKTITIFDKTEVNQ